MGTPDRERVALRWLLPLMWAGLPASAAGVISGGLDGWSSAPAATAEALLWVGWAVGLAASLAPRPWGFTLLHTLGISLLVLPAACAWSASGATLAVFAIHAVATNLIVSSPPIARRFADGGAYGDERRYPLVTPVGLAVLIAPAASVLLVAGIALGPVALADGRTVLGVVAVVIGAPLAGWLWRSLHALWRRWLILVPGGIVVHDPLLLSNPVLIPRAMTASITRVEQAVDPGADLRLGARTRAIAISSTDPIVLPRGGGRRHGEVVLTETDTVTVSVALVDAFLADTARRGLVRTDRRLR